MSDQREEQLELTIANMERIRDDALRAQVIAEQRLDTLVKGLRGIFEMHETCKWEEGCTLETEVTERVRALLDGATTTEKGD